MRSRAQKRGPSPFSPAALYLGIADGAASNWRFLEPHTERQLIDFFHASEYLGQLAQAAYPQRQAEGQSARVRGQRVRGQVFLFAFWTVLNDG
jgi:succinylarginine dihydrolase